MKLNQQSRKKTTQNYIGILSVLGLIVCLVVLLPQVTQLIVKVVEQIIQRELYWHQMWLKVLPLLAMTGICFFLFNVKQEIKDCLSEINFRLFLKPVLILSGVYLLGMLTIMRANFTYLDDCWRSVDGLRLWYKWSRYIVEFISILIHGDTKMTDISPLPQLLAIIVLSISSVLLVYVISNGKITIIRVLASIPLGISPFFLECFSYKYDAPYMALSIFVCIIPFLFIARKKAFLFCSVVSVLSMCMIYQAASGIYPLIVMILCFQDWNSRKKPNKEILSFMGMAALAFCCAMLFFKIFLIIPQDDWGHYIVATMLPLPDILSGTVHNIKEYTMTINDDLGAIWKIWIVFILIFFITKSMYMSAQKKLFSFFISILVIGITFILSYGLYSVLVKPLFSPRALLGFGVFISILCIYVVSDYKKIATVMVFALNWCLLVFAFSYGNALADQARYGEFRIGILLHDLSSLYPHRSEEGTQIQLKNSIEYTPSVKNISKRYPVIERLVPKRLGADIYRDDYYYWIYNNFKINLHNDPIDFMTLDLPVVLDSYYHTIRSDGNRILVILKH